MLTINGQVQSLEQLQEGASLDRVIVELGLKPDRIAVEYQGEIVSRREWPGQAVSAGDRLEIVHFVGGGSIAPLDAHHVAVLNQVQAV